MKIPAYTTRPVDFDSQGLTLRGVLYLPAGSVPSPAVIVCHPHPLYGGSMDNNVVEALCEGLAEAGWAALKFNFRGVEGSQGSFDDGRGEQQDVRAALRFLSGRPEIDAQRIALAGYSAGAAWGLSALYADPGVQALAAVSPPLDMFDFTFLKDCRKPVFLISGNRDPISPAAALKQTGLIQPQLFSVRIVPEADHSWSGFESPLTTAVVAFFKGLEKFSLVN